MQVPHLLYANMYLPYATITIVKLCQGRCRQTVLSLLYQDGCAPV